MCTRAAIWLGLFRHFPEVNSQRNTLECSAVTRGYVESGEICASWV
jgi:hypothetical protein